MPPPDVPEPEILEAIAPGGGRPDVVLRHEEEGARIAPSAARWAPTGCTAR